MGIRVRVRDEGVRDGRIRARVWVRARVSLPRPGWS